MDIYEFDHKNIIKVFKGDCHGVVLEKRGEWDSHICFFLITEDDENWFESTRGCGSSYWIDDTIEQLQIAREWMNENCFKSKNGCGWNLDP